MTSRLRERLRTEGWRSPLPLVCFLGLALTLAQGPARAGDADSAYVDSLELEAPPPDLPVLSSGDLLFAVDAAGFPSRDSLPRVEFYLRVANDQLKFVRAGGAWEAHTRVDIRLLTPDGRPFRTWTRRANLSAVDSETTLSPRVRQVFQWQEHLEPGNYRVEFLLTDLQAIKKTLLGRLRKANRDGTAEASLHVRPFSSDSLEVSDLEFAESFLKADSSVFRKERVTVYPNPGRRYGRTDSDVKVYLEGHLPAGADRASLRLVWEVLDIRGRRLMLLADSLLAGPRFDRAQVLRLQSLRAGRYHLRLSIQAPDGPRSTVQGDFDMAWAPGAVLDRSVVALTDEARVIFENEELDAFLEMSAGEQENYWNEYWNRINQSPDSPEGDARLEFESRIQYANENYGGKQAGMLTDRGRVFARYGPPDEITQSVMPVGGESLTDLGDQIGLEGTMGAELLKKQGASGVGDTRPYEIWDYDLHDRRVFGTQVHARTGSRIRFVFVDELGVGEYILKYTSE